MNAQITFASALLASAVLASGSGRENKDFMGFASLYNKHYKTVEELSRREQIYEINKAKVNKLNENNNGVRFEMNATADLDDAEFGKMLGLKKRESGDRPEPNDNANENANRGGNGRRLQEDRSIDWVAKGHVTAVKDQGYCGSCWAFAASTVQEAMQSIRSGDAPQRISEQEIVDCDPVSYGCSGGWSNTAWNWSHDNGSIAYDEYPYEAVDSTCRHQEKKDLATLTNIVSRANAETVDYVYGGKDAMIEQIQKGPMTVYVSAGNDCWRYYSSGVLSSAQGCHNGYLDHAVVATGLDQSGDEPHWKLQNSWGTWWGASGFIHMAIEDGTVGVSGMYEAPMKMDVIYEQQEEEEEEEETVDPDPVVDTCAIDETQNQLGPHLCWEDAQCRGDRYCLSNQCSGYSNCADEVEHCDVEERQNDLGPSLCYSDAQCKGDRYCWENVCYGTSNCANEEDPCDIDETYNFLGIGMCFTDSQCQGDRYCWNNKCEGYANCKEEVADSCSIDETQNDLGPHQCWDDSECQGERYCSWAGWCHGDSMC